MLQKLMLVLIPLALGACSDGQSTGSDSGKANGSGSTAASNDPAQQDSGQASGAGSGSPAVDPPIPDVTTAPIPGKPLDIAAMTLPYHSPRARSLYAEGAGLVPFTGAGSQPADCATKLDTRPNVGPFDMDGEPDEWTQGLIFYGAKDTGASGVDLLTMSFGTDDESLYFGLLFRRDFTAAGGTVSINIHKTTPSQAGASADSTAADSIEFDTALSPTSSTYDTAFIAAVLGHGGRFLEIKLPRAALTPHIDVASAFFSVIVENGDQSTYTFGAVDTGLIPDYGCLVAMPDGTVNYMNFSHEPGLDAAREQLRDRSFALAMPLDEEVMTTAYKEDTIRVTTRHFLDDEFTLGHFGGSDMEIRGIEADQVISVYNDLELAAHEYGHGFNSVTYLLPVWLLEGHSDYLKSRASGFFYGPQYALGNLRDLASSVVSDEVAHGVMPLGDSAHWEKLSSSLNYHKGAAFHGMLSTYFSDAEYTALLASLDEKLKGLDAANDQIAQFTKILDATGKLPVPAGRLTKGWLVGSTYDPAFSPEEFYKDSDGDGLSDVKETILGTDPHKADTDGDLVGEGAEVLLGRDPLHAEAIPAGVTLVMDSMLTDWSTTLLPPVTTASYCGGAFAIQAIGAAYDDHNLYLAARLDPSVAATYTMQLVFAITKPDGTAVEMSLDHSVWRRVGVVGADRYFAVLAGAAAGHSDLEAAIPASFLFGSGQNTMQGGLQVTATLGIAAIAGDDNYNGSCHKSQSISAAALPK